jgi:hypothetical protein
MVAAARRAGRPMTLVSPSRACLRYMHGECPHPPRSWPTGTDFALRSAATGSRNGALLDSNGRRFDCDVAQTSRGLGRFPGRRRSPVFCDRGGGIERAVWRDRTRRCISLLRGQGPPRRRPRCRRNVDLSLLQVAKEAVSSRMVTVSCLGIRRTPQVARPTRASPSTSSSIINARGRY